MCFRQFNFFMTSHLFNSNLNLKYKKKKHRGNGLLLFNGFYEKLELTNWFISLSAGAHII